MTRGVIVILLAVAGGFAACYSGSSATTASTEPTPASPPPRPATVVVTVLDEGTDRWFTSSELYLKVESSLEPGVAQLLPINVGQYRGQQRVVHETMFHLQPGKHETLVLEWLDDQTMTSDQRAAVAAAINDGGSVLVDEAQLWLLTRGVYKPLSGLRAAIREFGKAVAGPDARQFSSFGRADYNVPDDPPESYQATNPTIVLHNAVRAKAEARFFYPRK